MSSPPKGSADKMDLFQVGIDLTQEKEGSRKGVEGTLGALRRGITRGMQH